MITIVRNYTLIKVSINLSLGALIKIFLYYPNYGRNVEVLNKLKNTYLVILSFRGVLKEGRLQFEG